MIELSGVHKTFGSHAVLRGVDLTIAKGTSMVIIGGSGTGKSVLLKSILGLIRHDSGSITLDAQGIHLNGVAITLQGPVTAKAAGEGNALALTLLPDTGQTCVEKNR